MLIFAFFCFYYAYTLGWNSIQIADCAKAALDRPQIATWFSLVKNLAAQRRRRSFLEEINS